MLAGRVGKAHGLDGSFYVADAEARVVKAGAVFEGIGEVLAVKGTADRPIVRVAGVTDRTAAEALRGRELLVPDEERPELDDDEFWAEELVGCAVVDGDRPLGTVRTLLGLPSCEALELDDGTLVPLVRDAIAAIDVEQRRIVVNGGFLGLAD